MSVFEDLADAYDLFYADKDYAAEVDYVISLIRAHHPGAESILDLGCGTGRHAAELARHGFRVQGIDASKRMLERAGARREAAPAEIAARLSFGVGDCRSIRLGETFDVVTALFHVVSYQQTNADLLAMFATSRAHLHHGGVFIFDTWHGPGVLHDQPTVRVKRISEGEMSYTRIAEPTLDVNGSIVVVNYELRAVHQPSQRTNIVRETHQMRYLFSTEVDLLASATGFRSVAAHAWLTSRELSLADWQACHVLEGC